MIDNSVKIYVILVLKKLLNEFHLCKISEADSDLCALKIIICFIIYAQMSQKFVIVLINLCLESLESNFVTAFILIMNYMQHK